VHGHCTTPRPGKLGPRAAPLPLACRSERCAESTEARRKAGAPPPSARSTTLPKASAAPYPALRRTWNAERAMAFAPHSLRSAPLHRFSTAKSEFVEMPRFFLYIERSPAKTNR